MNVYFWLSLAHFGGAFVMNFGFSPMYHKSKPEIGKGRQHADHIGASYE